MWGPDPVLIVVLFVICIIIKQLLILPMYQLQERHCIWTLGSNWDIWLKNSHRQSCQGHIACARSAQQAATSLSVRQAGRQAGSPPPPTAANPDKPKWQRRGIANAASVMHYITPDSTSRFKGSRFKCRPQSTAVPNSEAHGEAQNSLGILGGPNMFSCVLVYLDIQRIWRILSPKHMSRVEWIPQDYHNFYQIINTL